MESGKRHKYSYSALRKRGVKVSRLSVIPMELMSRRRRTTEESPEDYRTV